MSLVEELYSKVDDKLTIIIESIHHIDKRVQKLEDLKDNKISEKKNKFDFLLVFVGCFILPAIISIMTNAIHIN
jgi:hypothetical protein